MENRKSDPKPTEEKEFELFKFTLVERIIITVIIALVAFLIYYGATVLFFGEDFWLDSLAPGLSISK